MDYYSRPLWIRYVQGVFLAVAIIIFLSKDVLLETHFFAGLMAGVVVLIELYYNFKK